MGRRRFNDSPISAKQDELAKQEEELRRQVEELQRKIEEAPRLAQAHGRRETSEPDELFQCSCNFFNSMSIYSLSKGKNSF